MAFLMLVYLGITAGLYKRPNKFLAVMYGIFLGFTAMAFMMSGAGFFYGKKHVRPFFE